MRRSRTPGTTSPADDATVEVPVDLVAIAFTGEAIPVGDRVALTPGGLLQQPVDVQTIGNTLLSRRFDPPLTGGRALAAAALRGSLP